MAFFKKTGSYVLCKKIGLFIIEENNVQKISGLFQKEKKKDIFTSLECLQCIGGEHFNTCFKLELDNIANTEERKVFAYSLLLTPQIKT